MDDKNKFPQVDINRSTIKDQATDLLREVINSGKITSGSKITERDVVDWLKISRIPARDALMELEHEGLIVTKADGRYVMGLSEQDNKLPQVDVNRSNLKEQATDLLREMIVSGNIAPGTKITERDVADWLKVSRMPARDALMDLERQGLIVSRPGGRYVIELSEQDVHHLYYLRTVLEKATVELAIANSSPVNQAVLEAKLAEIRQAITIGDMDAYTVSDLEFHKLIWEQAGNPYLLDMLNSMIGPIFMFIASQAQIVEDWQESLYLHEQLVETIHNGDVPAAIQSIEAHIQHSLTLALSIFKK